MIVKGLPLSDATYFHYNFGVHFMKASIKNLMFAATIALIFALFSLLVACTENNKNPIVRVSLLPDTSKEQLDKRFKPLLEYVTKKTGVDFQLIYADSYSDLYEKFINKEIDLAYFGGYTYVKAHKNANAEPLMFRDTDERFYSVVIVKKNNPAKNLTDLKNTDFTFGSKLSTSGHLMPRYFFSTLNIKPEKYFSKLSYSGSHQKTALMVQNNEVTAGVANAEIIQRMFEDGRLNKQKVRILWTSPPFPDYVWAMQSHVSNKIKNDILDAFLSLNKNNSEQANILKLIGAQYFLPATHDNFAVLENTVTKLNLIK